MPETPRRWRQAWALFFFGIGTMFVVAVSFFAGASDARAAGLGDLGSAIAGLTSAGGQTVQQAASALPLAPPGPAPVPAAPPPPPPIVNTVVAPVANLVAPAAPVVAQVVQPVVQPVAEVIGPIVAPLPPVVGPIVAPLPPVVGPIVAPVEPVVGPIVAPLPPVVSPIVAPVEPVVDPVVGPIVAPLDPVVDPVVGPVIGPLEPVVDPVTGPVLGSVPPVAGGGAIVGSEVPPAVQGSSSTNPGSTSSGSRHRSANSSGSSSTGSSTGSSTDSDSGLTPAASGSTSLGSGSGAVPGEGLASKAVVVSVREASAIVGEACIPRWMIAGASSTGGTGDDQSVAALPASSGGSGPGPLPPSAPGALFGGMLPWSSSSSLDISSPFMLLLFAIGVVSLLLFLSPRVRRAAPYWIAEARFLLVSKVKRPG